MTITKVHNQKKNYFQYLLVFIVFLFPLDTICYTFLRADELVALYIKLLYAGTLVYSIFKFTKWNKLDRVCAAIFFIFLVKLIAESLIGFGSFLIYPTVLAVIYPFLYVFYIKNYFKKFNINYIEFFIAFFFLFYIIFMGLHGRNFSLNIAPIDIENMGPANTGDSRILGPGLVLMAVVPLLFFLNKLFNKYSHKALLGFMFSLIIILIHQHRTVWITAFFSVVLFIFMKNRSTKLLRRALFIMIGSLLAFTLFISFIPTIKQIFIERFSVILNPLEEDTTSQWRYLQILAYFNVFLERPILGWGFTGFQMPGQFIVDQTGEITGHHFHDAYIEILFYFGIAGLLLKYYPLYKITKSTFSQKISDNSKILIAFGISGFIYSFSYIPPITFWGVVGMCMYYIDKDMRLYKLAEKQRLTQQP